MIPPQPIRKSGSLPDHARASRARKQAEAEAMGIDAAFVSDLVERFYGTIRQDPLLGPIFTVHVADWPAHLARLKQFWRSILHSTGEYTGNPMRQHAALSPLTLAHFRRWLDLFYATLADMGADPAAQRMVGTRARMIADSLLTGMSLNASGLSGGRAGADLPWPPHGDPPI